MSWGRLFETGHTRSLRDTVTSVVSGDCRTATSASVAITLRYQFYIYWGKREFRCPFFYAPADKTPYATAGPGAAEPAGPTLQNTSTFTNSQPQLPSNEAAAEGDGGCGKR